MSTYRPSGPPSPNSSGIGVRATASEDRDVRPWRSRLSYALDTTNYCLMRLVRPSPNSRLVEAVPAMVVDDSPSRPLIIELIVKDVPVVF